MTVRTPFVLFAIVIGFTLLGCFAVRGHSNRIQPLLASPRDTHAFDSAIGATWARHPDVSSPRIRGAVIPHVSAGANLAVSMVRAMASEKPDLIVLLSPDHEERASGRAVVADLPWETPVGRVPVDKAVSHAVSLDNRFVRIDNAFVESEYGITEVIPYIAAVLPGVPVVPIVVSNRMPPDGRSTLITAIDRAVGTVKGALVVSADLSHYLTADRAVKNDDDTLGRIRSRNRQAIRAMGSDRLDAAIAIDILLGVMDRWGSADVSVLGRGNTADTGLSATYTTGYAAVAFR